MSRPQHLPAIITGVLLALAVPAGATITFDYSTDFNDVFEYFPPPGWTTTGAIEPSLPPIVMAGDPPIWATQALPPGGVVDYNVAWSGGKRLTLIHPAETAPGQTRAVSAWYAGQGEQGYPLDLQANSLQAEFDLVLRTGTGCQDPDSGEVFPGDGATFAVQPVTNLTEDTQRVGQILGGLGWAGIDGFAIEFDLFYDAAVDPAGDDGGNHVGLDVRLLWDGGTTVQSLTTHLDPPAQLPEGLLPRFTAVGDNNQPLHVTVIYNDPDEGGAGIVRVYLRVDPATKDPNEPGDPISFGMEPQYDPYGVLILEACVGGWPTPQAIFGFTASTGGCDAVIQIDNVSVTADDEDGSIGLNCTPNLDIPGGDSVTLDAAGKVAECSANLSDAGWNVRTYQPAAFHIPQLKSAIASAEFFGTGPVVTVTGEPDLNYNDGGCPGVVPSSRLFPGIPADSDNFGLQATGWICLPVAGEYVFDVRSDDGFELVMGSGANEQLIMTYDGGRDCSWASRARITVTDPGVYPVRVLYFEGDGGAGLEFAWVETPMTPLLQLDRVPIGVANGFIDEPLVFGLLNGQPAPIGDFAVPPIPVPIEGLLAGTGTGASGFEIKTVYAPVGNAIIESRDDDGNTTARRFLALLQDESGGAVATTINFRDSDGGTPQPDGDLPNGADFPGVTGDNFALRARGYATFSTAGTYWLSVDWDDHAQVMIGGRSIMAATTGGNQLIPVEIPAAGTYPIEVKHVEFLADARVELGEFVDGVGLVPVNGTGSTISVHTQVTSGAYDWPVDAQPIPAGRLVAPLGSGDTPGWSATLAKAIDVGAGSPPVIDKRAYGTMLIENDHSDLTPGVFPQATDQPADVNYSDIGETSDDDRFDGNRELSVFGGIVDPAGGNDDLALSVQGYIEFPAAGLYGLNFNADDGAMLWVGGQVITMYPFGSPPRDATPAIIAISAAGLYDIRVDFFEHTGGMSFEVFQYLPDGTVAALNSPAATVTVYRSLNSAPASTAYANPVALPASAKAAPLGAGGTPGMRVQVVNRTFTGGSGNNAFGGDPLRHVDQAGELLAAVLDGVPSFNQAGTLVADEVVPAVSFWGYGEYPGPPNPDDFAVRVSGYLELEAGGHLFEVDSDNGFNFWVGGDDPQTDGWYVGRSGSLKGAITVPLYFSVEEAGLYRFVIEYFERDGDENLRFGELRFLNSFLTSLDVNVDPEASPTYADLQGCNDPAVDTDGDGDVDLADLALITQCASGSGHFYCPCVDLNGDTIVDGADFLLMELCFDGPDINADCGQ